MKQPRLKRKPPRPSPLNPIRAARPFLTKADVVAEILRQEILTSVLTPGSPVQQDELAVRLHVSATPVREAFRLLESEGLLEARPHRGVVVASRDVTDLDAFYELRVLLEPAALRRARDPIDQALIADLEASTEATERLRRLGEMHAVRAEGIEFHKALARTSGSRLFTEVVISLLARVMPLVPYDASGVKALVQYHVAITSALSEGAIERAARLLEQHMSESRAEVCSAQGPSTKKRAARSDRTARRLDSHAATTRGA